jgi:hypothetical protein
LAAKITRTLAWRLAKAEQVGLKLRLDDVTARTAVTLGNDVDEYLSRDPVDSRHQDLLNDEIANRQRRLTELLLRSDIFSF